MGKRVGGVVAAGLVALACACGGGGGGADAAVVDAGAIDADTTGPLVRLTTPTADATNVARLTSVLVSFNEAIDPTTVTGASFWLEDAEATPVAGSITVGVSDATFVPDVRLRPETVYTAHVATAVTDVAGNSLAAEYTWSFTARAAAWGDASELAAANAASPRVAVDAAGNTVVVWLQSDGSRNNVWANRYVPGSGWGTAELVETTDNGSVWSVRVAMGADGRAFVVWEQQDGTRWDVWTNRYEVGSGWATAVLLEADDTGDAQSPSVAVDGAGNAIAAWQQSDGTRVNIVANRYVQGTGWTGAQPVDTTDLGTFAPDVAMDASGNALAVWTQSDGMRYSIWANRYVAGTGWSGAVRLEAASELGTRTPRVAVNASGNAVVAWQDRPDQVDIRACLYSSATGWGTPVALETDNTGDAVGASVAIDGAGNALVVWQQRINPGYNSAWANKYVVGTGWGGAEVIETGDAGHAYAPSLAMDAAGNAIAVWSQSDGTRNNVWSNRYVSATDWGTATLVEVDDTSAANAPDVASNDIGDTAIVWVQGGSIQVRIFE